MERPSTPLAARLALAYEDAADATFSPRLSYRSATDYNDGVAALSEAADHAKEGAWQAAYEHFQLAMRCMGDLAPDGVAALALELELASYGPDPDDGTYAEGVSP